MGLTANALSRENFPLVMKSGLGLVARSHTLRCDARQAEARFRRFDDFITSVPHFFLGEFLPNSIVKGDQPQYIESIDATGIPVVSTLAIQQLAIREEFCRFITEEDFVAIPEEKRPKKGDVLVTMDGGTSIGKPVLVETDQGFAVDAHVAILRPVGLDARWLVYLLASPIGQVQFQRAESGASGQTGVNEEDLRLFRFPKLAENDVAAIVGELDKQRAEVAQLLDDLRAKEQAAWDTFAQSMMSAVS